MDIFTLTVCTALLSAGMAVTFTTQLITSRRETYLYDWILAAVCFLCSNIHFRILENNFNPRIQPNPNKSLQNQFDKIFFGSKFPDKQQPISSYRIETDQLIYTPYEAKNIHKISLKNSTVNLIIVITVPKELLFNLYYLN